MNVQFREMQSIEAVQHAHQSRPSPTQLEYVQLQKGRLRATYRSVAWGQLPRKREAQHGDLPLIDPTHQSFSRQCEVFGSTPSQTTSLILNLNQTIARWNGFRLTPDTLPILPPYREMSCLVPENYEFLYLHLSPRLVDSLTQHTDVDLTVEQVLSPNPYQLERLRRSVLSWLGTPDAAVLNDSVFLSEQSTELIDCLTAALIHHGRPLKNRGSRRAASRKLAKLAHDYIETTLERPITSVELAQACDAGIRSIQLAFQEHYDIPPITYQRIRRLHAARDDLQRVDNRNVKVTEVAQNRGFSHLGRFATEYRQLFNESPSLTRRNQSQSG